jgi:hypothetical protein
MERINVNAKCNGLQQYPFLLLSVSVLVMGFVLPLVLFYTAWKSDTPKGGGYIPMGDKVVYIPSISRTWLNTNAALPILAVAVMNIEVYAVCLVNVETIMLLVIGMVLALMVFVFNDGVPGSIAKAHMFWASVFFVYLLVMLYLTREYYPDPNLWWYMYIPMGICFLVMLASFVRQHSRPNEPWPPWVALAEYFYVATFFIYLALLGGD